MPHDPDQNPRSFSERFERLFEMDGCGCLVFLAIDLLCLIAWLSW